MAFYSYFAQRAEAKELLYTHAGFAKGVSAPFYVATRGLGSLSLRVAP